MCLGRIMKYAMTSLARAPAIFTTPIFIVAEGEVHHSDESLVYFMNIATTTTMKSYYWAQSLKRQPTCSCQNRCISTDVAAGGRPIWSQSPPKHASSGRQARHGAVRHGNNTINSIGNTNGRGDEVL